MTEQNEPTLEQLQAIESELGAMLVDYFADRGISPTVGELIPHRRAGPPIRENAI